VKEQLDLCAKFIDSTLKVLFKRDDEFKAWPGQRPNTQNSKQNQKKTLTEAA
jgi:hypothetical protein